MAESVEGSTGVDRRKKGTGSNSSRQREEIKNVSTIEDLGTWPKTV